MSSKEQIRNNLKALDDSLIQTQQVKVVTASGLKSQKIPNKIQKTQQSIQTEITQMTEERTESEALAREKSTIESLKKQELVERLQKLLRQADAKSTTQFIELQTLSIEQLQELVDQAEETQKFKEKAE